MVKLKQIASNLTILVYNKHWDLIKIKDVLRVQNHSQYIDPTCLLLFSVYMWPYHQNRERSSWSRGVVHGLMITSS